jgi:hypothetical protein
MLKNLLSYIRFSGHFPQDLFPKYEFIEERNDLDKLIVDELHGTLISYKMRIEQDNPPRKLGKEATFKSSKRRECKISDCSYTELYEEEAKFVRKLKNK